MARKAPIFLFFAAAALGASPPPPSPLQWPLPRPALPPAPPVLLAPGALAARLAAGDPIAVIDARSEPEHRAGHLPGALPGQRLLAGAEPEVLRERLGAAGLRGTETVVVYGGADDFREVGLLFLRLEEAGLPEVRVLDGGIAAWRAAGGRVEQDPAPAGRDAGAVELHPPPAPPASISAEELASRLLSPGPPQEPGLVPLDLRAGPGPVSAFPELPAAYRDGHLPLALPLDLRTLPLPREGRWPGADEVRGALAGFGPRPGDPVPLESTFVLYGEDAGSPDLGAAYLLLRIAGLDVLAFPGGWRAWAAQGRPTVRVVSAEDLARRMARGNPSLADDRPSPELVVLDLRSPRDWALEHLPGALSLPPYWFEERLDDLLERHWPGRAPESLHLALYCYGPDCVRSRNVAATAAHRGFRSLLWFRGGLDAWSRAGFPVFESAPPETAPAVTPPAAEAAAADAPAEGGGRP